MIRTAAAVGLVLTVATSHARAERPRLGVIGSVGLRKTWGLGDHIIPYHPDEAPVRPAVSLTLTISISQHLAIGARVALAKVTYRDRYRDCYELVSTDHALALQYTDARFTVGAWLGKHRSRFASSTINDCVDRSPYRERWTDDFTSYGATATFDVFRRESHHVAIVVDVQTGMGGAHFTDKLNPAGGFNYSALTLGLGYRR